MAYNLSQEKLINQIINDVARLKQQMAEVRTNQAGALQFGLVTLDENGVTINTTGDYVTSYLFFKKSDVSVGRVVFQRYIYGADEVSDMIFRSFNSSQANRVTYSTLDIYNSDLVTRDLFFQINSTYAGGSFSEAGLTFGKEGQFATFQVKMTNSSGGGYAIMPKLSSDPSGSGGEFYYNTGSDKVRVCENGVWRDA